MLYLKYKYCRISDQKVINNIFEILSNGFPKNITFHLSILEACMLDPFI